MLTFDYGNAAGHVSKNGVGNCQPAIAFLDPASGRVSNHWIELHQTGTVAGFVPLLVMDVWEHAFLLDYKPADRPKYIDAFLANVDWRSVEHRIQAVHVTTEAR